jgi:hypothetical protein
MDTAHCAWPAATPKRYGYCVHEVSGLSGGRCIGEEDFQRIAEQQHAQPATGMPGNPTLTTTPR